MPHDGIAFVVGDFEPLNAKTIARVEDGIIEVLLTVELWPFAILYHTNQRDIVFIDKYRLVIDTGVYLDRVARSRRCDRCLNRAAFFDFVHSCRCWQCEGQHDCAE